MPPDEQGENYDRYTLIPRTLIFITCDECVLLLKGAPNKPLWANLYNGLGGHIEQGEDVLSAAKRELAEETGLSIPELWMCGTITVDTDQEVGIGIFVFRGESTNGEMEPSTEGDLEWISINELSHFPLVEDLYTLIPRVLSTEKSDSPFSAHYSYDADGKLKINFSN